MSDQSPSSQIVGRVLRAPKTAELIATHLRRRIVRGELLPGEMLPPEVQLMGQFGVSRPTLREAFRILESELLIIVRRGSRGGAQVLAPDPSVAAGYVGVLLQIGGTTINDVYEARMVSEPSCARLLATCRTAEDLADFTEVIDALRAEITAEVTFVPDPATWTRLTYRFHELILQRCGNRTLAIQGAVLQDIVATHIHTRISQGRHEVDAPERFKRALRSYAKFVALIEVQDADGAQAHWLSHMRGAADYLLKDDLKTRRLVDLLS